MAEETSSFADHCDRPGTTANITDKSTTDKATTDPADKITGTPQKKKIVDNRKSTLPYNKNFTDKKSATDKNVTADQGAVHDSLEILPQSQQSSPDQADQPDQERWNWRFWLQLEDVPPPNAETAEKKRVWVIVNDESGRELLGMEACKYVYADYHRTL